MPAVLHSILFLPLNSLYLAGTLEIQDAQLQAVEDAKSLAEEALKKGHGDSAEVSTSGSQQQTKAMKPGSHGADEFDPDDDWDTGKGKGKKKGKPKARGKGRLSSGELLC